MIRRPIAGLAALAMLSACKVIPTPGGVTHAPPTHHAPKTAEPAPAQPPLVVPPPPPAKTAAEAGVRPGPAFASFGINPDGARAALVAFRLSCPGLQRRTDGSGLTQAGDWSQPCERATGWPDGDAANFFANQLAVVQVSEGQAFVTGYYEPEIAGSRAPAPGY